MAIGTEYSLADIAAASGNNRNNGNGGIFGGDWGALIVLFLLFGLFGGGGWGWGNGGGGIQENYVLTSDFATIERKLDGVNNGLCSGFYQEAQLINGVNMQNATNTAAIQQTLTQGFSGLNTGMVQQGYETRLGLNNVQQQMSQCCCDLKGGIADINYNIANQANGINNTINGGFCQTNFNNQQNTRDIIDSQRFGTDRIMARLDAMETNRVREQLDNERTSRLALQGALDRAQLRTDIVNDIRPCPSPAYITCNPWAYQQPNSCYGCNG